jgi:hypothetical protein
MFDAARYMNDSDILRKVQIILNVKGMSTTDRTLNASEFFWYISIVNIV